MTDYRWLWGAGALCVLLYLPALFGPFTFDSVVALVRNATLGADPGSLQAWLVAIDSSTAGPTGRPISMLSFAFTHAVFGHSAFIEKGVNLIIHVAIAYLLYRWLQLLLHRAPALCLPRDMAAHCAAAAALLWLLNPLQVSTVMYSIQRMEQLSSLFVVLGLYHYTRQRLLWLERNATAEELSRTGFLVMLCAVAAVLSKEDGILLVALLAMVEWVLFQGRYGMRRRASVQWISAAICLLPALAVVGLAVWEPGWLQRWGSWRDISSGERLLTQARVLWHYISLFYWPDVSRMTLFHDDVIQSTGWWQPWTSSLAVAAWLGVLALCAFQFKRTPLLTFGIGMYLISHGVESTIIPLDLAYEHRNYLGNIGLALMLVTVLYPRVPFEFRRGALVVLLLPFCLGLAWRSMLWSDELRLYESQLRHHPSSERTIYYYANMRMRLADEVETEAETREHVIAARRYFEHLLDIDPLHAPALVSLLYIDSRWLPALPREATLDALDRFALERRIEPSDRNAIDLLQRCIAAGFCDMPESRLFALITSLMKRFPNDPTYPAFLAHYYGTEHKDFEQAIAYSEAAIAAAPANHKGYYQLASWHLARGEKAQAARALGALPGLDENLRALRNVDEVL